MNKLAKGLCVLLAGTFIQSSLAQANPPSAADMMASQERRAIYHARILKNMSDQGMISVDSEGEATKQNAVYLRIKDSGMNDYNRNLTVAKAMTNEIPGALVGASVLATSAGFVLLLEGETKMESKKSGVFFGMAGAYAVSAIASAKTGSNMATQSSSPQQWNALAEELLQNDEYNKAVNHQISSTENLLGLSNNPVYVQNRVELVSAFKTVKAQSTLNSIRQNNDQFEVNFTTFLASKNVISAQQGNNIQNIVKLMALQSIQPADLQPSAQNLNPITIGEVHVSTMLQVVNELKRTTKDMKILIDLNDIEVKLKNEARFLGFVKTMVK